MKQRVKLQLASVSANSVNLIEAFQAQAFKEGWTKEEVGIVLDECKLGNYDHLLCTLMKYCEEQRNSSTSTTSTSEPIQLLERMKHPNPLAIRRGEI